MRGILNSRSKEISIFQKLFDPFVLAIFSFFIYQRSEIFSFIEFLYLYVTSFFILNFFKFYESYRRKSLRDLLSKLFLSTCLIFILIVFYNFNIFSFSHKLIFLFISIFLYLFSHHFLLRIILRYLRKKGLNSRNIVFFGNQESYQNIARELKKNSWLGYQIIYWFSPNKIDLKIENCKFQELECKGNVKDFIRIIKSENLKKALFAIKDTDEITFNETLNLLGDTFASVSYIPTNLDQNFNNFKKEYYGKILAYNIWNSDKTIFNIIAKRIFDISLGLIILLILAPLFFILYLLVKFTSKGPVFFKQLRHGKDGRIFKIYKFRTLTMENKISEDNFIQQVKKNDKRLTKIGSFLRKYSIDELPQLINVIKGEMSLVGPRPHAIQHNEFYRKLITGYMQRHSILPGMTGLAQIRGARGETSNNDFMKLRIKYDLEYINNANLILDIRILVKTFFYLFKGDAY